MLSIIPRIFRAFRYCLRSEFKYQPLRLVLFVTLYALAALGPAFLVQLVDRIGDQIPSAAQAFLLAALIGVITSLGGVATQIGGRMAAYSDTKHRQELLAVLSSTPARDAMATEQSKRAREASQAVSSHVAPGTPLLVSGVAAVVSVVALCLSVGQLDALAGLLMFVGLAAVCAIDSFHGAISDRAWPAQAEEARHAVYSEDLLLYPRSAGDLALLKARGWVAQRAQSHRDQQARILMASNTKGMLCDIADMVIMTVALTGVIFSLRSHAATNLSVITVGLLGVVSASAQLGQLSWAFGSMANSIKPIESFVEFVKGAPGKYEGENNRAESSMELHTAKPARNAVLHASNLTARYSGKTTPALNKASFSLQSGEILGIAGENGAGKTTLVNVISGVVDFTGALEIFGTPVSATEHAHDDYRITVMSQDFGRYEYTVRETLLLGDNEPGIPDAELWHVLEIADAADFVESLPAKLDTRLGEEWGGVGLSGGQWQRLALARCFLRKERLMILDEPTSSIDAASEEKIISNVIRECRAQDIALILVSHRATSLRLTDQIVVLQDGVIREQGAFEELVSTGGVFSTMFKGQLEVGQVVADNTEASTQ